MLARTNKLLHPSGSFIETPLLVPSFSSKGFGFKKKDRKKNPDISEVVDAMELSKEFLTESLLVSAYDLHYKHIPYDESYFVTDVIFIDSGGYETGNAYDQSAISKYNYDLKEWNIDNLHQVLNSWPEHKAGIIVSYDHGNLRCSLEEQIAQAEILFDKFPNMYNDFLIKPETKDQKFIKVPNVIKNIKNLHKFNIIGVTERELGNSILKRMLHLHEIRTALDSCGNKAPIHVFGSLDPVTSILYFLAGAEIFDGLTWLKYSYFCNAAIYSSNYGVINPELSISTSDKDVKSMSLVKNVYYLNNLKYTMKDFINSGDFNLFDKIGGPGFGNIIENSYKRFQANL